ncbi:NAD-dependent formate dehydrogenase delta subunit [Novosphingobium resinovorum]|uniref:NAD-dependent formate dehydrogenase delta subunit n=1 Tax=Novosphingobium resinovorum TaxID=158500 RepID=A0A031K3Z8_9SPHN|nr:MULTISPECIES: formate dehydrogenase subunit delta [Novosphingobium]EZP83934.1 NAD-dependent formate dehydrogenase delta subunit [Novosphingobium resinovorum]
MAIAHDEDGVMSTGDRLIYMANQIARNLASEGTERSIEMVADHIRSFWDPAMRRRIVELAHSRPETFSAIASAAIERVAAA